MILSCTNIFSGTAGLGKQSVLAFARHSPTHIYFTGRDQKAADALIAEINRIAPDVMFTFLKMDFTCLASVQNSIADFKGDRLDLLICNAGIMAAPPATSSDSFEIHFAVNHMAHAMILRHLLPSLRRTAEVPDSDVRVVCLTSEGWRGHPCEGIRYSKIRTQTGGLSTWLQRYG